MHTSSIKKKIVFVLPNMNPGGAERVLVTLMNNVDREKFSVSFVSLSKTGPVSDWIASDIEVYALNRGGVFKSLPALLCKLKSLNPDIIVTTMTHCNAGLLLLKPFFLGTKFIVRESTSPHAMIHSYGYKNRLFRYVYKYLYPFANYVLVPALMIEGELRAMGMKTLNYRLLYNPVDEEAVRDHINWSQTEDEHERMRFLCVGRLTFEKGYERLIEALSHYSGSNWRLDIVGGGDLQDSLQKAIEAYNLQNHIFLQGHQNNPWQWIAGADCLLLPSLVEGMPNTVLESLACGTAVIAHQQAGGAKEIAALAEDMDVKIVQDMDEFLSCMAKVRQDNVKESKYSRLPAAFKLKNVMAAFEKLL